MKKKILLMFMITVIQSCISLGQLDYSAEKPQKGEGIFIIGLSPSFIRIGAFPGEVKDGVFNQNKLSPAVVWGNPDNGYLIGRGKAGQTLAFTTIVLAESNELSGQVFEPCAGAKTVVFKIPDGKTVYLSDIKYTLSGEKLYINLSANFESAKKYIDENFINLKGSLETSSYELLETDANCKQTIYVPIYTGT